MYAFRIALNSIRAFFGIMAGDSIQIMARKILFTGSRRLTYFVLDYWLAAVTAAANIFLKASNVDLFVAFAAMWGLNIVISYAFVLVYERTGVDVSLGVDFRRAVDRIHTESKAAGIVAFLSVLAQAVFWSGPEQIVIFFEKELPGLKKWFALFALTAIQTVIWMYLWRTGYDVVVQG